MAHLFTTSIFLLESHLGISDSLCVHCEGNAKSEEAHAVCV